MQPTLLVLAAGIGRRYGGLKQIEPVGPSGEIIIDYSIHDALKAGFKKFVFIIPQEIENYFRLRIEQRIGRRAEVLYLCQSASCLPDNLQLPDQRAKPWGTGHAILTAQDVIQDSFLVINADDYYGCSGYQIMSNFFKTRRQTDNYAMVGFRLNNTLSDHGGVSRGVCQAGPNNFLRDVAEYTQIKKIKTGAQHIHPDGRVTRFRGHEIVSMNMWGFTPSIFRHLNQQFREFLQINLHDPKAEFYIPAVVNNIIKHGLNQVEIFESEDEWFGITHPQDRISVRQKIRRLVDRGIYPRKLFT